LRLIGPYLKAGLRRTVQTAWSATRHPIEERLPLVDVPTLIIGGELDEISPLPWTERLDRTARAEGRAPNRAGRRPLDARQPPRPSGALRPPVRP
jgi:pimeloyl-ACP methyl ester carboxylesterase